MAPKLSAAARCRSNQDGEKGPPTPPVPSRRRRQPGPTAVPAEPCRVGGRLIGMRKLGFGVAAALIVLSGCAGGGTSGSGGAGTSPASSAASLGTITGILERAGGPYPGTPVPEPGRIEALSESGQRYPGVTAMDGKFRLAVPPGVYQVTGYSPEIVVNGQEMRCVGDHAVRVTAGQTAALVTVMCAIP